MGEEKGEIIGKRRERGEKRGDVGDRKEKERGMGEGNERDRRVRGEIRDMGEKGERRID